MTNQSGSSAGAAPSFGRISELEQQLRSLRDHNAKLVATLGDARDQLVALKQEVDQLGEPPNTVATFLGLKYIPETGDTPAQYQAEVLSSGRKLRTLLSPHLTPELLEPGQEVVLNEALNVIEQADFEQIGEIVTLKEVLPDTGRAIVTAGPDMERVVRLAGAAKDVELIAGDSVLVDTRAGFLLERLDRDEAIELELETVPDVTYDDIGGLADQLEMIRDAVEMPFLHGELFEAYDLRAPKGVLLYGPPGCGKTLIAKAVANSLAEQWAARGKTHRKSFFLNIKGPELLNKYVGESERQIRLIFEQAREKAAAGYPVVIFFDEMDALFRIRGTGISSDVETTIVPQLLSELDGVEKLEHVIIIGASNREDMIDPAILRPGRLDIKIKVERPNANAANDIFSKYLTPQIPLHPTERAQHGTAEQTCAALIDALVDEMYAITPENQFLEVTYQNGERVTLYFKDFASGAMIASIVARAKKAAIKESLSQPGQEHGIRLAHLRSAMRDEFQENEDLPNTTNPEDWARISGQKGERVLSIRSLLPQRRDEPVDVVDVSSTGQYL